MLCDAAARNLSCLGGSEAMGSNADGDSVVLVAVPQRLLIVLLEGVDGLCRWGARLIAEAD
jgi:hypothetical protein